MNSKPLTYDSSKTVIQYMDPNLRFLLSSRIPSIRTVEKAVPLKINKIRFEEHLICVDKIAYEYGVYQVDCKLKIPHKGNLSSRLNLKSTCDVDEFGIRDYITRAGGMLPGNNGLREENLFGEYDLEIIPTNEGRIQKLKKRIELEKERYNQVMDYRPKENLTNDNYYIFDFIGIRHDVPQLYKKEELELLNTEKKVKEAIEYIKEKIERMEYQLLPFENRMNNIRPKFEIQLTKQQTNSEPCVIERVKYEGDLHKAGDSIMEFMFAKRPLIQVNKLTLFSSCLTQLPSDMKMRIRNLKLLSDVSSMVRLIKPFIDESSFPCEKLKIDLNRVQELDQEFFKQFKKLIIDGPIDLTFPFIQHIPNQIVHFQSDSNIYESPDFIDFIRNWVDINKSIGTCFTFYCYQDDSDLIQILNRVKDQIEGAIAGDKSVVIPMKNSTVLEISYQSSRGEDSIIKMAVMPIK